MHAFDRPVVEAGDAESAAVTHTAIDDLPRVGEIVFVVPDHLEHIAEVFRLRVADAKGRQAGETFAVTAANTGIGGGIRHLGELTCSEPRGAAEEGAARSVETENEGRGVAMRGRGST